MSHATPDNVRSLWISAALAFRAAAAALGYGCTLGRFLRIRPNVGDAGFLGLFCLGVLGLIIHFALPLSGMVKVFVLLTGLLLAGLNWREIRAGSVLKAPAIVVICVAMLVQAQALPQSQSDMGGYHLQALRWSREYPIVMGLGNLHGRLAFNSVTILISALIDDADTRWILSVLAAGFFWISVFIRFNEIRPQTSSGEDLIPKISHWLMVFLLSATALVPKLWGETWVLNADIFTAYLVMYWVVLALGYTRGDRTGTLALLVLTSSLATAGKLSAAPLLLATVLFVWFHFRNDRGVVLRAVAAAGLLMVAWTGRSVLLSGCAIYPVRQTCMFSMPWAESADLVYDESVAIRSWARLEGEAHFERAMHGWSWLPEWIEAKWRRPLILFLLLGSFAAASALFHTRLRRGVSAELTLVSAALAGCLGFWFLSAPDERFASGSLFSAGALGLSMACAVWLRAPRLYSGWRVILMLLLIFGGLLGIRTILLRSDYNRFKIPEAVVYGINLGNGRGVWVPVNDNSCWNHPLPCTPYVDPEAISKVRMPAALGNVPASAAPPVGWKPQFSVNPYPNERECRGPYGPAR
ncbi:MAG: hypothetical protein JWN34_671 [Bryobacterales bacterium]|nr:hypothetical protein [Bryobacterales bacterium]